MGRRHVRLMVGSAVALSTSYGVLAGCVGDDPGASSPQTDDDAAMAADRVAPASDASTTDAAMPSDATTVNDGGRCDPTKPFGPRRSLDNINAEGNNFAARLTTDEKTVYFSSTRRDASIGANDTWVATRSDPTASFTAGLLLNGGNTTADEASPTITEDGLTMYIASYPGGNWEIYRATRATATAPFGTFVDVPIASSAGFNDEYPYVLPNGSALYFESDRTGKLEIYRSPVAGGTVDAPTVVQGLTGVDDGYAPWVSANELTIYFASTRAPSAGPDIWSARRSTVASVFGTPTRLPELSTPGMDLPSWVSEDDCVIVWSSSVALDGATGGWKVYVSERPK